MTTALLYGVGAIAFLSLVILAYFGGSEIANRRLRTSANPTEPLRCECRRYAFPSPLCPRHGGLA